MTTEKNLPLILNGQFFKILNDDNINSDDQITAKCQLCVGTKGLINGSKKSTGNFHLHLKRKHPEAEKNLKIMKGSKRSEQNKAETKISRNNNVNTPFTFAAKRSPHVSQQEVNELVLNYIVNEMRSLSTTDKPSFKNLVAGLSGGCNSPSRQTITKTVFDRMSFLKNKLKTILTETEYVCTTADIWSAHNRSYMGVTCHIMDKNLNRKSFLLRCSRMKFSHTYIEIAKELSSINLDYQINGKVVGTVTDNASNFGKAFRIYSLPNDNENDFLFENSDLSIIPVPNFEDTLNSIELDEDISLPVQFRCCSHTLNLIATTNADKALSDVKYKKIYHTTIGKLTAIWNAVHRSTKASDEVENICNSKLCVPCATRWNSMYDSIMKILAIKEFLPSICEKLGLPKLKIIEIEYSSLMAHIARGIDILQDEYSCYLGFVLPTIFQIVSNIKSLSHLEYCEPLKQSILDGLNKRFPIMNLTNIESKPYILATISLPRFKLKWCNSSWTELIKKLFTNECEKVCKDSDKSNSEASSSSDEDNIFFQMISDVNENETATNLEMELVSYLQDKGKDLKILHKYPTVLRVFLRYNTILPSSAPVERIFSTGGQILTPRRSRLSDHTFEALLFLKSNDKSVNE